MLYSYNFSLEKFINLIKDNFFYSGENGLQKDVEILYYFLMQKYSAGEIEKISLELVEMQKLSSVEFDKIMSFLANKY